MMKSVCLSIFFVFLIGSKSAMGSSPPAKTIADCPEAFTAADLSTQSAPQTSLQTSAPTFSFPLLFTKPPERLTWKDWDTATAAALIEDRADFIVSWDKVTRSNDPYIQFLVELGFEPTVDPSGLWYLKADRPFEIVQNLVSKMTVNFEENKDFFVRNGIHEPFLPVRIFENGKREIFLQDAISIEDKPPGHEELTHVDGLLTEEVYLKTLAANRMPIGDVGNDKTARSLAPGFRTDFHHNLAHFFGFLKSRKYLAAIINLSRQLQTLEPSNPRSHAVWYFSEMLFLFSESTPREIIDLMRQGPKTQAMAIAAFESLSDQQILKQATQLLTLYDDWVVPVAGAANDTLSLQARRDHGSSYKGDFVGIYRFANDLKNEIAAVYPDMDRVRRNAASLQVYLTFLASTDPQALVDEMVSGRFQKAGSFFYDLFIDSGLFLENTLPILVSVSNTEA